MQPQHPNPAVCMLKNGPARHDFASYRTLLIYTSYGYLSYYYYFYSLNLQQNSGLTMDGKQSLGNSLSILSI